MTNTAVRSTN